MTTSMQARRAVFAAALVMAATPAAAHHPMGGKLPSTFMEGLLSGVGHPVIGPDHLAFILGIGIAASLMSAGFALVAAFVAASTAGVLLHLGAVGLPMAEAMVAVSVVAAGTLVAVGRRAGNGLWLALAGTAGIFHGYAFAEAVVGVETTVVGAYLIGIALVSAAIAGGVMTFARTVLAPRDGFAGHVRIAGVLLACVGVVMLVGGLTA
jgi:urease accessory protein